MLGIRFGLLYLCTPFAGLQQCPVLNNEHQHQGQSLDSVEGLITSLANEGLSCLLGTC